jgi:hypothetical protein
MALDAAPFMLSVCSIMLYFWRALRVPLPAALYQARPFAAARA